MNVKKEIERRDNMQEEETSIIGTEIKNRRLSMSLTLAALADKTCSTSYLCKIEKSQIVANDRRLEEICQRVGMTKNQYNDLIHLKKALTLVCDYYFKNNTLAIQKLKQSLIDFTNYRSNIINYVIALYEKNELQANRLSKSILAIIREISDLDLLVFTTFYSIDLLSQNKVLEASDNIKAILEKQSGIESLEILQMECLFESAYISCSVSVYRYYEKLKMMYYNSGLLERCQKLFYKMAMYELMAKRVEFFQPYFSLINDGKYRYNLIFIKGIITGEYSKMKKMLPQRLEPCLMLLYYYYFDSDNFKLQYKRIDRDTISKRECLFIDFLHAKVTNERTSFLLKRGIPRAIECSDGFMMRFFLESLSILLQNTGSYLCFYESYKNITTAMKVLHQI